MIPVRRPALAVGLAGALGFTAFAWHAGQDASWDLQNYHDYAAYAFLHWRYGVDVAMGGFQGYLNPLPYLVPFLLRHTLAPLPAALALAVGQSVLVIAVWTLAGRLLPPGTPGRGPVRLAATLVGSTGAATLSEIGTSFADLPLAVLVLAGLAALLPHGSRPSRPVLAGLLVGAATGLKLTNAVFAPGLLAVCCTRPGRPAPRTLAAMAGLCAGFGLTGAPWAAFMALTFGNPVFPAFNTLFRSPSAAFSDYTDPRFLPHGLADALLYPVRIAAGLHPTAEVPFADPRLLLATAALALLAAATRLRRSGPAGRPLNQAALFGLVSAAAWLAMFAIQRYAVAIEALSGVLLVTAAARLFPGRLAASAALLAAAATLAATRPPDWWRRPWSAAFSPVPPPALAEPAAFAVVACPIGYWASALPAASRFYGVFTAAGLASGGVLARQRADGLAHPPGGRVWTLGYDFPMPESSRAGLAGQGLVPAPPCVRARSLWWVDTVACHTARPGPRLRAAADLPAGARVDFTGTGDGWMFLGPGWGFTGPSGTASQGAVSELVAWPVRDGHPLALDITLAATDARVEILLDGAPAADWPVSGVPAPRTVCLPEIPPGTLSIVLRQPGAPAGFELRSVALRNARAAECPVP